jgi:hypothetical protein
VAVEQTLQAVEGLVDTELPQEHPAAGHLLKMR